MYGGNVGAVCRAMMNMGLSDLAIAAPREDCSEFDVIRWSLKSRSIYESRRECATLAEAVQDCTLVAGTSSDDGFYRKVSRTPREWAPSFLEAASQGPVALVFGPENNGLSNEDLALCTDLIRIPSTPKYASLNLSQAVLLCAYELYLAADEYEPPEEGVPLANSDLRERMFGMWRETLLKIGFMESEKADHMMMALRRILSRGNLTEVDARIMMGIARQTSWYTDQPRKEVSSSDANAV